MKEKYKPSEGFYTCEIGSKGVQWSKNIAEANGITVLAMGASLIAVLAKSAQLPLKKVALDMVTLVENYDEWLEGKDE